MLAADSVLSAVIRMIGGRIDGNDVSTMDLTLARTFLEVVSSGNFSAASERLHVTQSTVSARIRTLEDALGQPLFVRNKSGAVLTPTGRRFQRHAAQMLRSWEHAREEVGVPDGYEAVLRVGGEAGLWMRLLYRWIPWMQAYASNVALRVESGTPDVLMQHLIEGTHDLGVMYTPQSRPGLIVELLVEEDLVLVCTPDASGQESDGAPAPGYIHIDWGREFHIHHAASFPDYQMPGLLVGMGTLAFRHVLENGGSGYFPDSLVREHVAREELRIVENAPCFSLPIYVVYPAAHDRYVHDVALYGLRQTVAVGTNETQRSWADCGRMRG